MKFDTDVGDTRAFRATSLIVKTFEPDDFRDEDGIFQPLTDRSSSRPDTVDRGNCADIIDSRRIEEEGDAQENVERQCAEAFRRRQHFGMWSPMRSTRALSM